jgi:hypothetical protein
MQRAIFAFDEYFGVKKRHKIGIVILLYVVTMVAVSLADGRVNITSFFGGMIGLILSSLVAVLLWQERDHTGAASSLLFYRSLCDIGLSLRFALGPLFNHALCGNYDQCYRSFSDEKLCAIPSAYLEFFVISSEAWFLLNGVDLYYSISNPFSSFQSRKLYYHLFVWSVSIIFALSPFWFQYKTIYGFFYITAASEDTVVQMENIAFCWVGSSSYFHIWYYFFIPVLVIYALGCCSLIFAYKRLRKGITKTFLPRMRLLVINTVNVVSLLIFWLLVLLMYLVAYVTSVGGINGIVSVNLSTKSY